MAGTIPSSSPQKIAERWLVRLALLFLLCLLALAATFIFWRVRLSRIINRTLSSIHAAGYPTNLVQVEQQYYPQIPSNENAAPFFQSAFDMLQVSNNGKYAIPSLPDYQSKTNAAFFSAERLQQIYRLLATNHDALDLLRQSSRATNCRYAVDLSQGIGMLLPHLEPLRNSARLLTLQAVIHAKKGDTTAAIDDLNATFRLCHSLDREPVLISQLARIGAQSQIIASLEHVLNSGPLTDTQLVQLSQTFHDLEKCPGMEHAIATELCNGIDAFQSLGFTAPQTGTNASGVYTIFKLIGFFDRDLNFYIQNMSGYLRLESNSFPAKIDAVKALDLRAEQECSNHYYIVSSVILPSLGRVAVKECAADARLKIIQTVLAIERFRLANQNRLPNKLDDLVPTFLPSVPADPFDSKPIRYKKLAKGYMVYSVGEDRKDDGGVYAQPSQRLKPGAQSDITFVVER